MITSQTDHGERLINDNGVATPRFQDSLDEITDELNKPGTIYTVATVPDATLNEGIQIYVQDETGGATIAFSDGTNWRRVQDRVVIS